MQDSLEFEATLSCIVRSCLNKNGVCLFSDIYRKNYSVYAKDNYHSLHALKI